MTAEENVMELREKQAFWAGVVRGVIGSAEDWGRSGDAYLLRCSDC